MVPGGSLVTSRTTRLTSATSFGDALEHLVGHPEAAIASPAWPDRWSMPTRGGQLTLAHALSRRLCAGGAEVRVAHAVSAESTGSQGDWAPEASGQQIGSRSTENLVKVLRGELYVVYRHHL